MPKEILQTSSFHIKKLDEARRELGPLRNIFVLASFEMLKAQTPQEITFWGNIWSMAFEKQDDITRRKIAPAKIARDQRVTNLGVEDNVRVSAANFARWVVIPVEFANGTVNHHIEVTKKIQRELGVLDKKEPEGKPVVFTPRKTRVKTA